MDWAGRGRGGFARRGYPYLVAQNDYLRRRARWPAGTGRGCPPVGDRDGQLPGLGHTLHAVPADLALFDIYTRRDLDHAGHGERPTDQDYARYIRLGTCYRDHGYDDDWVRAEAEFCVVDPGFNALWAWSELALAEHAGRIGA